MTCAACDTCPFEAVSIGGRLPYEIHVTVGPESAWRFPADCASLGVNPILIDMQEAGKDLMTSSTHFGDDATVLAELGRIAGGLMSCGHLVVREKVEAAPWHAAAPTNANGLRFGRGQYFESHLAVKCVFDHVEKLRKVATREGLHLSANAFKRDGDIKTMMATLRSNRDTLEAFQSKLAIKSTLLAAHGFPVSRTIVEFALFDSNVRHDAKWVAANDNSPATIYAAA
jgi:hypothetical protein